MDIYLIRYIPTITRTAPKITAEMISSPRNNMARTVDNSGLVPTMALVVATPILFTDTKFNSLATQFAHIPLNTKYPKAERLITGISINRSPDNTTT